MKPTKSTVKKTTSKNLETQSETAEDKTRKTQSYTYKFEGLRWVWPDGHVAYDPPPDVADQIRAYGRHYNNRIEIVRWSRQEYREARKTNVPEFLEAEEAYLACRAEVEKIRTEMKALHQEARRRKVGVEIRARLTEAVQKRKAAGLVLQAAKVAAAESPSMTMASNTIYTERTKREKEIRANTPAYWGTYLMAEDASQVAAKKAKSDPEFRRWLTGLPTSPVPPCPEGKIGVQIQSTKPLTIGGLYEQRDTRLQLAPSPPKTRWRAEWVRGRIRIGSNGRDPIWAEFEVRNRHVSRMPLDARITWAWVNRRRLGTGWRHALCIGVERQPPAHHSMLQRTLAFDINMRIVENGIRIGYSYNGDTLKEYVLPRAIIDKLQHSAEIRSTRDQEFDRFRDELVEWFKNTDVPPWMKEKTEHLSAWRSSARLAGVVLHWRVNRFDHDEPMYLRAEQWRSQDRHLASYSFGDQRGAVNRRRELYRQWANQIFKSHGTVVVAAWNWSEMARLPKVEEENDLPDAVRSMRFAVAPSDLVAALSNTARHRGGRMIKAELGQLAKVGCLFCNSHAILDDKEGGWITCMSCGQRVLRDEMQAKVLYANRERFGDTGTPNDARKQEAIETAVDSSPSSG